MFGFGKKKIVANLELGGVTPENKELPPLPMPPKALPEFPVPITEQINKKLETILGNQHIIYAFLQELKTPEATVLDNEELKVIPEEDKAEYFEMKKSNPKMAEKLLAGYKAEKKAK